VGVKYGLPPIACNDVRLFIFGSLPGDASLAAQRYYAHPTNQFWLLLGAAIGEDLQNLDYAHRLERLARRGIGLWDVIASASRPGSLDQAIRAAEHNRIDHLLRDFPDVRAVAFNGARAANVGRKLIGNLPVSFELIDLPSSSAANTQKFEAKLSEWKILGQFA
jgi:TDG/mug DNA glycosylase family protein